MVSIRRSAVFLALSLAAAALLLATPPLIAGGPSVPARLGLAVLLAVAVMLPLSITWFARRPWTTTSLVELTYVAMLAAEWESSGLQPAGPLRILEPLLLLLACITACALARGVIDLTSLVQDLGLGRHEVPELEDVHELAQTHITLSRRHELPLTVLTVEPDESDVMAATERFAEAVRTSLAQRKVLVDLGQTLGHVVRNTDVLAVDEQRLVVICPATDAEGSRDLIRRIRRAAEEELNLSVHCRQVSFPDQALTLDEMLTQTGSDRPMPTGLAAEQRGPSQSSASQGA